MEENKKARILRAFFVCDIGCKPIKKSTPISFVCEKPKSGSKSITEGAARFASLSGFSYATIEHRATYVVAGYLWRIAK